MFPWEYAAALDELDTPQDCIDLTHRVLSDMGFRNVLYASVRGRPFRRGNLTDVPAPKMTRFTTIDPGYEARYAEQQYHEVCPIYREALKGGHGPIVWTETLDRAEAVPKLRQMLDECGQVGIRYGVSIPIHDQDGGYAGVGISTDLSRPEAEYIIESKMSELFSIGHLLHGAMIRLARQDAAIPDMPDLTDRELECLRWAALGKSSWEIGQVLSIRETTVNFHLKNVREKFGVSTRTAAVTAAYALGLLQD
jgi:LuxR family transcriptional activator of conjugal transfer of Ti plasmids